MVFNFQPPTRKSLPILVLKGSYYEVGYEIGRTFGHRIRKLGKSTQTAIESAPGYNSNFADNVFANAANIVKYNFPQLWEELWGMADGAQMDFRQLFTLQLVDILIHHNNQNVPLAKTSIVEEEEEEDDENESSTTSNREEGAQESDTPCQETVDLSRGCSDVLMNINGVVAIGHTEDLSADIKDECYVTRVHYKDSDNQQPRGKLPTNEEFISSYCYPGDLPGFAMATSANFAVSLNDLSSVEVDPWGTPKGILARAALACRTIEEMVTMLTDAGHGVASGMSLNVMALKEHPRRLYNIEVACREGVWSNLGLCDGGLHAGANNNHGTDPPPRQSRVSVHEVVEGEVYFHCNLYQRLGVAPNPGKNISSDHRMAVMTKHHSTMTTIEDVKQVLSDESDSDYPIFRDKSSVDRAKTAAIGIFDGTSGKWTIFTDKANNSDTLRVSLPIQGGLDDV